MSSPKDNVSSAVGENDPYAAVERAAELVWERVQQSLTSDEPDRISDRAVVLLMTAALKLYARKCDGEERSFRPLLGNRDEVATPTEVLTTATELLRAVRLGPTEFALWSRRRPENYHESSPDIVNPN
jgi:hypothetical protein